MGSLLEIVNLRVGGSEDPSIFLLDGVSFSTGKGEVVCIMGQSGCGKTTLIRAISRTIGAHSKLPVTGSVRFKNRDILAMNSAELINLRRKSLRCIFQDPAASFNPLATISSQCRLATRKDNTDLELFDAFDVQEPEQVLRSYPHQLSTGTLQRIMIVMAISVSPEIILADEPTSAVDARVKWKIMEALASRCRTHGMSLLMTTHDRSLAHAFADRIIIMREGKITEVLTREMILHSHRELIGVCASGRSVTGQDDYFRLSGEAPSGSR